MSTYHTPSTYDLDIRDCAAGGLDFISPRSDIFLLNSRVENNLGRGLNILGQWKLGRANSWVTGGQW